MGGDDIDRAIVNHWREKAYQENKEIGAFGALRHWAEKAKIQLSNDKSAHFCYDFEGSIELNLTYDELVKLAAPILDKTWISVKKALKDADLKHADIQEVVLVGGSTRFPLIEEHIKDWFHSSRINNQINPDEVVALGGGDRGRCAGRQSQRCVIIGCYTLVVRYRNCRWIDGRFDS